MNTAERRHRTARIVARRKRQWKMLRRDFDPVTADDEPWIGIRNRSPISCPKPRCLLCHHEKVLGIEKAKYRKESGPEEQTK